MKEYDWGAVQAAWELFRQGQLYHSSAVRDVVTLSWMRAQMKELDPLRPRFHSVAPRSVEAVLNARPMLFSYLFSHFGSLEEAGHFSRCLAVLTDARGVVLKLAGNEALRRQYESIGVAEGFSFHEDVVGTNAIGTALHTREPVAVWGNEHYIEAFKDCYGNAAPIRDHNGELVAALGLMTESGAEHPYPLALACATADNVQREIKLYHRRVQLLDDEARLDVLINAMNYGVLFLDGQNRVLKINSIARYYLLMYEHEIVGMDIAEIIASDELDFAAVDENLLRQPLTITTPEGKRFQYLASVYRIPPRNPSITRCVVTLNPYQAPPGAGKQRKEAYVARYRFDDVVGTHPAIKEAVRLAERAAGTDSNILITGESGTGKELFAQAIHNASAYAKGPFVALNCGAIPGELIESELFGYEEGAFTGARKGGVAGKFELADGGTIFLDEIGDMPPRLQVSLLRFLQNHEVTRLGGKRPVKVHVRVITATNKNLEEAMAAGTFRSDLYYRINIVNLRVPPLRERGGDIVNLAHYFLQQQKARTDNIFTGFAPEAREAMQRYPWPGNVRELENAIERALLTARSPVLALHDLPEPVRAAAQEAAPRTARSPEPPVPTLAAPGTIQELERAAMTRALAACGGNVTRAALELGMSRRTFYRKMERYGIHRV